VQYNVDKGCHSIYAIQFHLVMCVNYGKRTLTGLLDDRLTEIVDKLSARVGIREPAVSGGPPYESSQE